MPYHWYIWYSTLGPVFFNILIKWNSEMKCILRKSADDIKLSSAVDKLKDRISRGGTWTRLRIGPVQTSTNARSSTWVRAVPGINKDWEKNSLRGDLWTRTWIFFWKKSWTLSASVHLQPRRPKASWAASKAACQDVNGSDSPPLLSSHETTHGALYPAEGRHESVTVGAEVVPRMIKGLEHLSYEKAERTGFSTERRMLQGDLTAPFQYWKGHYKREGEGFLTWTYNDRTRKNIFKLREEGL